MYVSSKLKKVKTRVIFIILPCLHIGSVSMHPFTTRVMTCLGRHLFALNSFHFTWCIRVFINIQVSWGFFFWVLPELAWIHDYEQNTASKVGGCYLVTLFNPTPICDWYMVWWGSKIKHHKDTCLKDVGLWHLQKLLTSLHSTLNTFGMTYVFSLKEIIRHALPTIILDQGRLNFQPDLWYFIVDLLVQHTFFWCEYDWYKWENVKTNSNNTHIP